MTGKFIKIDKGDNVCVALEDLPGIPFGHKFAARDIEPGDEVIRYGNPIGKALKKIKQGEWVHTHNLKTLLEDIKEYSYIPGGSGIMEDSMNSTFNGYLRKDGRAGIRNELWIIPTVGCVNGAALKIKELFLKQYTFDVSVFTHQFGCSQLGDDHLNTQKILSGIIKHPNAGGVLVLGLGCENNTIDSLKDVLGSYDEERIKFLRAQDEGDELEQGVNILKELYNIASADTREPVDLSKLVIGTKCGGSDGFSGITANPLIGRVSDICIAHGASSILTEVPEMFGAEHLLMERAVNREVFENIVELINDFKKFFIDANQPVYENPSPGNKEGGITTLEEKSLGCIQKGGKSPVVDVLKYGDPISKTGLSLLSAPGNDLVASTALAASGCQVVLFSTGRGTPFGTFVPTVKISSNSEIFNRKKNWMDFDAGRLLTGMSLDEMSEEFFKYILEVANGKEVRNEKNGYKEIAVFKTGITL